MRLLSMYGSIFDLGGDPRSRLRRFALSCIAFALAIVCCALYGCKAATAPGVATAPATDPYVKAMQAVGVFSSALVDADQAVKGLHVTYVVEADGTTHPIVPDDAFDKVELGVRFGATAGDKLNQDLMARLPWSQISVDLAALTTDFAAKLAPDQVGIKSAASQAKYVAWVNIINAAVRTLAAQIATYQPQETSLGRSRDPRGRELACGTCTPDSHTYRAVQYAAAGRQAGRRDRAVSIHAREFRKSARFLARRYA